MEKWRCLGKLTLPKMGSVSCWEGENGKVGALREAYFAKNGMCELLGREKWQSGGA